MCLPFYNGWSLQLFTFNFLGKHTKGSIVQTAVSVFTKTRCSVTYHVLQDGFNLSKSSKIQKHLLVFPNFQLNERNDFKKKTTTLIAVKKLRVV